MTHVGRPTEQARAYRTCLLLTLELTCGGAAEQPRAHAPGVLLRPASGVRALAGVGSLGVPALAGVGPLAVAALAGERTLGVPALAAVGRLRVAALAVGPLGVHALPAVGPLRVAALAVAALTVAGLSVTATVADIAEPGFGPAFLAGAVADERTLLPALELPGGGTAEQARAHAAAVLPGTGTLPVLGLLAGPVLTVLARLLAGPALTVLALAAHALAALWAGPLLEPVLALRCACRLTAEGALDVADHVKLNPFQVLKASIL